jgi:hypothetical protein
VSVDCQVLLSTAVSMRISFLPFSLSVLSAYTFSFFLSLSLSLCYAVSFFWRFIVLFLSFNWIMITFFFFFS